GQNGGPAGRADRVGDEALREAHAFLREAVEVRRLVDLAAVSADGVGGVVVGHDVEDVRPGIGGGERRDGTGQESDHGDEGGYESVHGVRPGDGSNASGDLVESSGPRTGI